MMCANIFEFFDLLERLTIERHATFLDSPISSHYIENRLVFYKNDAFSILSIIIVDTWPSRTGLVDRMANNDVTPAHTFPLPRNCKVSPSGSDTPVGRPTFYGD